MASLTDEELLAAARHGDVEAFGVLYARHAPDARRYAAYFTRLVLKQDCADDVTGEAVRKTLSALGHGHGPTVSFRHYLRSAIRSVTLQMNDHSFREASLTDAPEAGGPGADEGIDTLVGMRAFRSLPEHSRQLLWNDLVDQIPPREAAPALGTTPQRVAVMAYRARQAFRVAYVRAHLPDGSDDCCCKALDLLARREVASLSRNQAKVLSAHLGCCGPCQRAESALRSELQHWARAGWRPPRLGPIGESSRASDHVA